MYDSESGGSVIEHRKLRDEVRPLCMLICCILGVCTCLLLVWILLTALTSDYYETIGDHSNDKARKIIVGRRLVTKHPIRNMMRSFTGIPNVFEDKKYQKNQRDNYAERVLPKWRNEHDQPWVKGTVSMKFEEENMKHPAESGLRGSTYPNIPGEVDELVPLPNHPNPYM